MDRLRRRAGLNYTELGERLGASGSYAAKLCKGQRVPSDEKLEKLIELADEDTARDLRELHPHARLQDRLPDEYERIVGALREGASEIELGQSAQREVIVIGRVQRQCAAVRVVKARKSTVEMPSGMTAVKVSSSDMEPLAPAGSLLLLADREAADGDLVVVQASGGRSFVRRAFNRDGALVLAPAVPADREPPVQLAPEEVESLHVVVGLWFGGKA